MVQAVLGGRVVWRLMRTGRHQPIRAVSPRPSDASAVAVIVPVLDEADRLQPCLEGLLGQGQEVGEIII
ncbi:MAG: glycosyltransferase, partial [Chloroflexota bacterium]|nr:glycosyltransferase [Chloroflexota bacterium]